MPLHPYFEKFFAAIGEKLAAGMSVPQAFQAIAKDDEPYHLPSGVLTEDVKIQGRHGEIAVRIYRPKSLGPNSSALLWFHGGGFVMGSIDQKEAHVVSAEVANLANCLVVSVDYRLVTKDVKFPVPLEDGFDAAQWLIDQANALGVNPAKVFIGGASAGGSLAATVCLKAAEAGHPIRGAILAYPLAHLELPEMSAELLEKTKSLPAPLVMGAEYVKNRNAFLMPDGPLAEGHRGWPAEEADLSAFAQALFIESEYDAIRASSEEFIRKLRSQGVAVESYLAAGMTHGFLNNTATEVDVVGLVHSKIADFISETSK